MAFLRRVVFAAGTAGVGTGFHVHRTAALYGRMEAGEGAAGGGWHGGVAVVPTSALALKDVSVTEDVEELLPEDVEGQGGEEVMVPVAGAGVRQKMRTGTPPRVVVEEETDEVDTDADASFEWGSDDALSEIPWSLDGDAVGEDGRQPQLSPQLTQQCLAVAAQITHALPEVESALLATDSATQFLHRMLLLQDATQQHDVVDDIVVDATPSQDHVGSPLPPVRGDRTTERRRRSPALLMDAEDAEELAERAFREATDRFRCPICQDCIACPLITPCCSNSICCACEHERAEKCREQEAARRRESAFSVDGVDTVAEDLVSASSAVVSAVASVGANAGGAGVGASGTPRASPVPGATRDSLGLAEDADMTFCCLCRSQMESPMVYNKDFDSCVRAVVEPLAECQSKRDWAERCRRGDALVQGMRKEQREAVNAADEAAVNNNVVAAAHHLRRQRLWGRPRARASRPRSPGNARSAAHVFSRVQRLAVQGMQAAVERLGLQTSSLVLLATVVTVMVTVLARRRATSSSTSSSEARR